MLVLTRKQNERIIIGDGANAVVITMVDIGSGKARLGIEAPRETSIVREELLDKPRPKRPAA